VNCYKTVLLLFFLVPAVGSANGMWFSQDESDASAAAKYFGIGVAGSCVLHFLGHTVVETFGFAEQPLTAITCFIALGGLVADHFWSRSCKNGSRTPLKICAAALGIYVGSDYGNIKYISMINWLSGRGSLRVTVPG